MKAKHRYPIGLQNFPELREKGYHYIDKTEYVWRMTHAEYKYAFLSRPRRFGKSLLMSTLKCYFEGKRALFEGLDIEKLETEWAEYPVLHFDMSTGKHLCKEALERNLISQLIDNEKRLGIQGEGDDTNTRFRLLVARTFEKTGKQVVILIDEYDSPLLDVMHEDEELPVLRKVMTNFYSPLKACDPYIRFCFLTGITKFSQLSIFSALNNIKNISMDPSYAAICGISKEELLTQMSEDIDSLAERLEQSREQTIEDLVKYYDGYHFCWPSPDIFNPYSLLNAFSDGDIRPYWFETATPTYIVEMLRKFSVVPSQVGKATDADATSFDAPTERLTDITPLMYQSGYSTIKTYDRKTRSYTLDIPNQEVKIGLMRSLLPHYVQLPELNGTSTIVRMYRALLQDDMDGALQQLQTYIGTIPYTNHADNEGHWQEVLYIIFSLMGMYVDVEVHTSKGRIDVVMRTDTILYVIELKMNQSAEAAIKQIDIKDYPSRFALCGLPIVKVGINFNGSQRNITNWVIEGEG